MLKAWLKEVNASLYPWDIADEGINSCLDNLQTLAGMNSVYMVGLVHQEVRPTHPHQTFFPHNPVRRYFLPEDSRVYWKPDPAYFADCEIRPQVTEVGFLRDKDWLALLAKSAAPRGLKVGCEISRTVIPTQLALNQYRHALQRDITGSIIDTSCSKPRAFLCPNSPATREYLVALLGDLRDNYDLDFIQTCVSLFAAGRETYSGTTGMTPGTELKQLLDVTTGGCFCRNCKGLATRLGFDWSEIRRDVSRLYRLAHGMDLQEQHDRFLLEQSSLTVAELLLEFPGFSNWLHLRRLSVNALFRVLKAATRRNDRDIDFRYSTYTSYPETVGLDFRSSFTFCDSVRESDCTEQIGDPSVMDTKRSKLLRLRRSVPDNKPVIATLGIKPKADRQLLSLALDIAAESGCDGVSLAHYEAADLERLRDVGHLFERG